jgi:ATP-dependent 26S proteasome regulatory subunit
LKEQALKNKIAFHIFRDPKEFMEEKENYYEDGKKIFVFEDFDAFVKDRKKTGDSPNSVLASLLNTLEGIDEIKDVVSIFTTNRIETFDDAFLRPGRVDRVLTYLMPTKEQMVEFFDSYLPEVKEHFEKITEYLLAKNRDISYAVLKGICDDINILKFSGEILDYDKIIKVMETKLQSAAGDKKVSDKSALIL